MTAEHFIRTIFAPLLEHQDPWDSRRLSLKMRHALAGNPFTKAAVEMALWDIQGKAANLPVYRLLGGPVRDVVPAKWSISGVEPERAADIAEWPWNGFRSCGLFDTGLRVIELSKLKPRLAGYRLMVHGKGGPYAASRSA